MTGLNAFTMPKWGIEMTEGVIGEWKVAEGQTFAKGDLLALIETDKITNEVEAESDGVMCRIVAAPGDTLPVGALLAVTSASAAAADDVDAFIAAFGGTPVPAAKPPPAPETKKPASARKSAKAKPACVHSSRRQTLAPRATRAL
ncbi:MAG: hypothetical protein HC869_01100 [Rhodospirillales bacterium]|nr:hypothetical protein [Rhodospirillales bacterium]